MRRTRRIRIVHVLHSLVVGGAENGVVNLVNNMNPERFECSVCAFVNGGSLKNRIDEGSVSVVELGKEEGNDLRLPFRLYRLFRKIKPHIVHTHSWGTLCEAVIGAKSARVPVIIHGEHGTIQKGRRVNILTQRMFWHFTDQVLSVSEVLADSLSVQIGFPRAKIKDIANGVDTMRFSASSDGTVTRKSLGIHHDEIVIGMVGRLVPVKDYPTFLRALAISCKSHKSIKSIIVGDGPLGGILRSLASELGISKRVMFLGKRDDVPKLMKTMDIFVLSSLSEGMSNTILEAMASGLPAIATNVGGTPEIVQDGTTGILVPPRNPEKLAMSINFLIKKSDRRKTMGRLARVACEGGFSVEKMVSNYEKLYLFLLDASRRIS